MAGPGPHRHLLLALSLGTVHSLGEPLLARGPGPVDLRVSLGTPGTGASSFSFALYEDIPAAARPVARIRFPNREGGLLQPQTFKLENKC